VVGIFREANFYPCEKMRRVAYSLPARSDNFTHVVRIAKVIPYGKIAELLTGVYRV